MESHAIVSLLQEALPGAELESVPSLDLHETFYISRDHVPAAAQLLRDRDDLKFGLLAELTAADFYPREPRFELVYILVSMAHRRRIRMKVRLHAADARVATICSLWPAANWLEREVWDLFGIVFDGHPDPRRLLMPEDWDGYPLRKDYPVQINKHAATAAPLQVTAQEFRANVEKDRLARR
jgi:NADH-quinone oxidoreductase subunit C